MLVSLQLALILHAGKISAPFGTIYIFLFLFFFIFCLKFPMNSSCFTNMFFTRIYSNSFLGMQKKNQNINVEPVKQYLFVKFQLKKNNNSPQLSFKSGTMFYSVLFKFQSESIFFKETIS